MNHKKLVSLVLAAILVFSMGITALADTTATATVPVTLTVSNQYRAVNVTVPASLPIQVINGTVITATNARITNNSAAGSVQVTAVSVNDGACRVGSYDSFSGSNSIALKLNGCPTTGPGALAINSGAFPVIAGGQSLELTYYARVSADAPNTANLGAANVVFTISII